MTCTNTGKYHVFCISFYINTCVGLNFCFKIIIFYNKIFNKWINKTKQLNN